MQTARRWLVPLVLGVGAWAITGRSPGQDAPHADAASDAKSPPRAEGDVDRSREPSDGRASAFTLTIPGTTVTLDFVPVEIAEGDAKRTLWFAKTEATWDLYDAFVLAQDRPSPERAAAVDAVARPTKAYVLADRGFGHAGFPALSISAKGAEQCCAWLSALAGVTMRLPTEIEWETAARAGDDAAAPTDVDRVAWHAENGEKRTRAVATKDANAFGLHDVLGNVDEWCTGAEGKAVLRGGAYCDARAAMAYAARREPEKAWNRSDPQIPKSKWWLADAPFAGFRVVCEGVPK